MKLSEVWVIVVPSVFHNNNCFISSMFLWWAVNIGDFLFLFHEQPDVLCILQCSNCIDSYFKNFSARVGEGVCLLESRGFNFMTVTVLSLMDGNYQQNIAVVLDKYNLVHSKLRVITVLCLFSILISFFFFLIGSSWNWNVKKPFSIRYFHKDFQP